MLICTFAKETKSTSYEKVHYFVFTDICNVAGCQCNEL